MIHLRTSGNFHNRSAADATSGIVDDALQSFFVVRIGHQSEIGDDVFNFLSLIKAQSAINAIRNVLLSHFLLKRAALRVSAIKNGKIVEFATILALDSFDVFAHNQRFLFIRIGRLQNNLVAFIVLAENILFNLPCIMPYQAVGRLNDALGGTIVLFQLEESAVGVNLLKVQNVVDICSTKSIDALRVIANNTNTLVLASQLKNDALLGIIGVLILVDQYILEPHGVFFANVWKLAKQSIRLHQQIVKIHRICLLASLFVSKKDSAHGRHLHVCIAFSHFRVVCILFSRNKMILCHRNQMMHRSRLVGFVIEIHLLDDGFQQRTRVIFIIDGEIVLIADGFGFNPENSRENRMERTHLQIASHLVAYKVAYALLHFVSRLVGERQSQNVPRPHSHFQQVGDLVNQHTRLSRPSTCNHQLRPVCIFNCRALAVVQLV